MIGIDLTRISRFDGAKKTLIDKVLHPDEQAAYAIAEDKALFLAERWAIKEALFKADNQYFHFDRVNIQVVNRVFRFPGYVITTSREDDMYFAMVLKEGR